MHLFLIFEKPVIYKEIYIKCNHNIEYKFYIKIYNHFLISNYNSFIRSKHFCNNLAYCL